MDYISLKDSNLRQETLPFKLLFLRMHKISSSIPVPTPMTATTITAVFILCVVFSFSFVFWHPKKSYIKLQFKDMKNHGEIFHCSSKKIATIVLNMMTYLKFLKSLKTFERKIEPRT